MRRALPARMAYRSESGTPAKWSLMVSNEWGQSDPPWGKSLDHIIWVTPMWWRLTTP